MYGRLLQSIRHIETNNATFFLSKKNMQREDYEPRQVEVIEPDEHGNPEVTAWGVLANDDEEPITGHQPEYNPDDQDVDIDLVNDDDDDEHEEGSDEPPYVPTEQEKFMKRERLDHTKHTGLPRPDFGRKRPRQQEPVELAEYFDLLEIEVPERIRICRAYASYLAATMPKIPKTPKAPTKRRK